MRDTEKITWWALLAVYGMVFGFLFTLSTFMPLEQPTLPAFAFIGTVTLYLIALTLRLTYLKGRNSK